MSARDGPRCVWCHKPDGTIKPLLVRVPNALGVKEHDVSVSVHSEHEPETRRFYGHLSRYARTFLLSVLLGVTALLVFAALGWGPGEAAVLAYTGIIFMVFPFSTGTAVELMGIKNSMRLTRTAGVVFLIGALSLLFAR